MLDADVAGAGLDVDVATVLDPDVAGAALGPHVCRAGRWVSMSAEPACSLADESIGTSIRGLDLDPRAEQAAALDLRGTRTTISSPRCSTLVAVDDVLAPASPPDVAISSTVVVSVSVAVTSILPASSSTRRLTG